MINQNELLLSEEITKLSQEITNLKTQQAYSTGQIESYKSPRLYVGAYSVDIPSMDGVLARTAFEVAASFIFKGSLFTKTAVGTYNVTPTYTGSDYEPQALFMAWLPTNNQYELRLGVVWRFFSVNGGINVFINTNMPGTFELERTYTVYIT